MSLSLRKARPLDHVDDNWPLTYQPCHRGDRTPWVDSASGKRFRNVDVQVRPCDQQAVSLSSLDKLTTVNLVGQYDLASSRASHRNRHRLRRILDQLKIRAQEGDRAALDFFRLESW